MTAKLVAKIEKQSEKAKKGTFPSASVMDLWSTADELRGEANGDKKLLKIALRAFELGAEREDPNAALYAGQMHLNGEGTDADPDEALKWFEHGAERGNWQSALAAAKLHYYHTKKWEQARHFAEKAAHTSNPEAGAANYLLALLAWNGRGEDKDIARAVKLHKLAAKQKDADAMFELYVLYSTGQGVTLDEKEALKWCKKAAEMGQHRACYNMGAFHATGRGVKKDALESEIWYRRAADAGNGQAAATLAAVALTERGPDGVDDAIPHVARALELNYDVAALLQQVGIPPKIIDKLLEVAG
jgi:uncharacterized protein